jgi:hypothetical protein
MILWAISKSVSSAGSSSWGQLILKLAYHHALSVLSFAAAPAPGNFIKPIEPQPAIPKMTRTAASFKIAIGPSLRFKPLIRAPP